MVQVVVNGVALVQVYLQCTPVEKRWDLDDPGQCMNPHVHVDFGYVQGGMSKYPKCRIKADQLTYWEAINTCTALCLSLIPAFQIYHLRVSAFHRISISILLGVGVMGAPHGYLWANLAKTSCSDAASSIVKTALLGRLAAEEDLLCESQSFSHPRAFTLILRRQDQPLGCSMDV